MSDFDLYESEIEELYQKPEEPKVELTIEEAKLALESAYISAHIYRGDNGEGAVKAIELCKALQKRIEKAEGK